MSPARRLASRAAIATMVALVSLPAAAQTADDLFDPGTLHDLRLFMNSRDLQQLRDRYLEDTYFQADLEWNGQRVRSVAVRSRGTGSRNPIKPGIRIDIGRYVSGQRFLGLDALVLDNLWQDPSLLRESVTMALFAQMGQPAPREAYVRLFINDVYEGVYSVVEPIDSAFLSRTFGTDTGYLFEYQWLTDYRGEYLGRGLASYKALFKAQNHASEGDAPYVPIHDLFDAVNEQPDTVWRASVERYLDTRQFLTHVAVELFVSEMDGLTGAWAMNNFFLHRPAGTTRHQFLAWDRDNAFQKVDSSVLLRTDENVLFRTLVAYDDLRAFYLDALETCARLAAEAGWLETQVAARASLIREAAYQDSRKAFSNEEFESEVAFLREFARRRSAIVLAEVASLRGN
jgi:spore coat protein CotH